MLYISPQTCSPGELLQILNMINRQSHRPKLAPFRLRRCAEMIVMRYSPYQFLDWIYGLIVSAWAKKVRWWSFLWSFLVWSHGGYWHLQTKEAPQSRKLMQENCIEKILLQNVQIWLFIMRLVIDMKFFIAIERIKVRNKREICAKPAVILYSIYQDAMIKEMRWWVTKWMLNKLHEMMPVDRKKQKPDTETKDHY